MPRGDFSWGEVCASTTHSNNKVSSHNTLLVRQASTPTKSRHTAACTIRQHVLIWCDTTRHVVCMLPHCAVLCCVVLRCAVLCCVVLCCIIGMPRRALQSLSAMYSASLYIFVLYYLLLLYNIILYYRHAPPRLAVLVGDVLGFIIYFCIILSNIII